MDYYYIVRPVVIIAIMYYALLVITVSIYDVSLLLIVVVYYVLSFTYIMYHFLSIICDLLIEYWFTTHVPIIFYLVRIICRYYLLFMNQYGLFVHLWSIMYYLCMSLSCICLFFLYHWFIDYVFSTVIGHEFAHTVRK